MTTEPAYASSPNRRPVWLEACGNASKHEPHGDCVGIPLPPLSETLTDEPEDGQG